MPQGASYSLGPVRAHVRAAANEIGPKFGITTVYGWTNGNPVPGSYHPLGRALDFMCSVAVGKQLVAYVLANRDRLGATEIIHDRTIQTAARGWTVRPYRGFNPHTDHVHVSFSPGAGSDGPAVPEASPPGVPLPGLPGPIDETLKAVGAFSNAAQWLANPRNWWRILMFIIGCILVLIALARNSSVIDAATTITKEVSNAKS